MHIFSSSIPSSGNIKYTSRRHFCHPQIPPFFGGRLERTYAHCLLVGRCNFMGKIGLFPLVSSFPSLSGRRERERERGEKSFHNHFHNAGGRKHKKGDDDDARERGRDTFSRKKFCKLLPSFLPSSHAKGEISTDTEKEGGGIVRNALRKCKNRETLHCFGNHYTEDKKGLSLTPLARVCEYSCAHRSEMSRELGSVPSVQEPRAIESPHATGVCHNRRGGKRMRKRREEEEDPPPKKAYAKSRERDRRKIPITYVQYISLIHTRYEVCPTL